VVAVPAAVLLLSISPGWLVNSCCCALIIVKLEAKRIIAMTTVSPVIVAGDTNNGEDFLITPRTRDRFPSKIRLWNNYSVKILRR
jgi:hypothetical protein